MTNSPRGAITLTDATTLTLTSTTVSNRVRGFVFNVTNTNNTGAMSNILQYLCRKLKASYSSSSSSSFSSSSSSSPLLVPTAVVHTVLCPLSGLTPTSPPYPGVDVNVSREIVRAHAGDNPVSSELLACMLVLILVTALLGNILVLATLAFNKACWTNVDISIMSLALTDLLVSTICIPLFLDQVMNQDWTFGALSCRTVPFFMQLAVTANMLTLCCLAADRYLAVVYPLKFNTFNSMRTTQALILLAWLIALAAAIPSAFQHDVRVVCGRWKPDGTCYQDFKFSFCSSQQSDLADNTTTTWICFVLLFVCPTLVMGVAYGIIIYSLWVKATVGMVTLSVAAVRNRYKRKAVKMLICVVLLFILSWAPLKIWVLVSAESRLDLNATTKTVDLYLKCLAMSSTAYNPIIYAFMNQKFRANFKTILNLRKKMVRVSPHSPANNENEGPRCNRHKHHRHHHHHHHCSDRGIMLKNFNQQGNNVHGKDDIILNSECSRNNNNNDNSNTNTNNTNTNNTTSPIPGSAASAAPKTTSTKVTTGSSSQHSAARSPSIIWSSHLVLQPLSRRGSGMENGVGDGVDSKR